MDVIPRYSSRIFRVFSPGKRQICMKIGKSSNFYWHIFPRPANCETSDYIGHNHVGFNQFYPSKVWFMLCKIRYTSISSLGQKKNWKDILLSIINAFSKLHKILWHGKLPNKKASKGQLIFPHTWGRDMGSVNSALSCVGKRLSCKQ